MSIISFVFPGIGTGALNSLKIQVSISLISHAINEEIWSVDMEPLEPVKMPHTVSRCFELVVVVEDGDDPNEELDGGFVDELDDDMDEPVVEFAFEPLLLVVFVGFDLAWHASIMRLRIFKHSRNIEKKG
jgi:hypothetical protein